VLRRREILPSLFCKELKLSVMCSEFTQERGREGVHRERGLE
jgi:hypothetical protein